MFQRVFFTSLFIIHISLSAYSLTRDAEENWLKELERIEVSTDSLGLKIVQLEKLVANYLEVNGLSDGIVAKIYHRLGDYYKKTGDYEKAIAFTKKAIFINKDVSIPHGDEAHLANSYFNLGAFYGELSLTDEFQQYMDSCILVAERFPHKGFIGTNAFERKSAYYFEIGDHHKSIEVAKQGLYFCKDQPINKYIALVHLQKAQAQLAVDSVKDATKDIEKAFEILPTVEYSEDDASIAYSIYALLLRAIGDIENAISYYEAAIAIDFRNGQLSNGIKNLSNIGNLYDEEKSDSYKALDSYFKGVVEVQRIQDPQLLAIINNNIGSVYWRKKEFGAAAEYFQKGLIDISIGFDDSDWQRNPSEEQIKNAENKLVVFSLLSNKGEALLDRFRLEGNEELLKTALNCYKLSDRSVDQMRWNHSHNQSKYYWRQKTKSMYENAIEICFHLQDFENAFHFFEKSRAVMLNDKLSELGSQQYLSEKDRLFEHELRVETLMLQQKLSQMTSSDLGFPDLSVKKFQNQETYEKFIKSLESKYPDYYQYKYDTSTIGISDVREYILDKDQSYLTYFTGKDHIYSLLVNSDTASFIRVEIDQYQEQVPELISLVSNKSQLNANYSRYRELAYGLFAQLIYPLSLETKRVIISPDDHLIPFDMLLQERTDPTSFLLKNHAFSYTYSAKYLLRNKDEPSQLGHSLLGIAPVNYQPHLERTALLGSDLSMNKVKSLFSTAEFRLNEMATKSEFLNQLPLHSIVHIYTHAEADPLGDEHKIYFSDSVLLVSELQALGKLPTKLILLTACNTGVGKIFQGEGIFSMARAFASTGIPSSISALWEIEDQSTYQVTELFYHFLQKGYPLDVAQQQAKLAFLESNESVYSLPYFWAGNILIGSSKNIFQEKSRVFYYVSIILICLIFVLVILFRKRWRRGYSI